MSLKLKTNAIKIKTIKSPIRQNQKTNKMIFCIHELTKFLDLKRVETIRFTNNNFTHTVYKNNKN